MANANNSEQVKPLAPAEYHLRSDYEDQAMSGGKLTLQHRRRCLQCFGCVTALLLVAVVIIIVIATVFHVKNPSIRMNSVTIQRLEFLNNGSVRSSGDENVALLADVSVKNPNYNSFKYGNTTTSIYYGGVVVGEGHIPQGQAKARRTLRMNVTVDLNPEKFLTVPSLRSDILSRSLNMSSYTRIDGKIKLLKIFKKSVVLKMNCSIIYNISSQAVQQECRGQGL